VGFEGEGNRPMPAMKLDLGFAFAMEVMTGIKLWERESTPLSSIGGLDPPNQTFFAQRQSMFLLRK
jgi:hypothetical protein